MKDPYLGRLARRGGAAHPSGMSSFTVFTPALGLAAQQLESAAAAIDDVMGLLNQSGDDLDEVTFGDINEPFQGLLDDAHQVFDDLRQTARALGRNATAAAEGYLSTDQGLIPVNMLMDVKA